MASSDLGGLGPKDGLPVEFNWIMSSAAPQLLPWLAIMGLLILKSNRKAAAWLIGLPLGVVLVFSSLQSIVPSDAAFFTDTIAAMAFGLTAVWLLSNHLRRSHRVLTFLCVLPVLLAFTAVAYFAAQGGPDVDFSRFATGILLLIAGVITTLALSVSGWLCRRHYRPARFGLWLLLIIFGLWLAISLPFFILAEISSGWRMQWNEFFIPVLAVAGGHFATLLPFVILSSVSPFYRERLKALLNVSQPLPPVLTKPNFNPMQPKESL